MTAYFLGAVRAFALGVALLIGGRAGAQTPFWQPTATHPLGPKIGLAHVGDSTLLTVVPTGLLRSGNLGRSWGLVMRSPALFSVFATRGGRLLAGGKGRIYFSADQGVSWDSVAVAGAAPVVCFVETPQGQLLAGTGGPDSGSSYVGAGVLFSADQGRSWTLRNTGLPAAPYVSHLAADRQGRVYLVVTATEGWQGPGLYRSADLGLSWQYIPLRVDGRGGIDNDVTPYEFTSLTLTPQDTLQCSFVGVAGRVMVRFNLRKHLNAVLAPSFWVVGRVQPSASWWEDRPANQLFVARNGDWYSSYSSASTTVGGTLRSRDQGRSWQLVRSGLGVNIYLERSRQSFAEAADGHLFMVQDFDPVVYQSRVSVVTATRPTQTAALALYPNPATETVRLTLPGGAVPQRLALTDLQGRELRVFGPGEWELPLAWVAPGVYVLTATLADGRVLRQRLVKQ